MLSSIAISLMNENDGPFRLLHLAMYATYLGVMGILVPTIAEMTQPTTENKMLMGISLATLVMNFIATLWIFPQISDLAEDHWKVVTFNIVFIFTGILSPYLAFSILIPRWGTWQGFAIICTMVVFVKVYNVLSIVLIWIYRKIVVAMDYVTEKFLVLILKC
nr:hypothetical protein [Tanacetum cinerariifolium]